MKKNITIIGLDNEFKKNIAKTLSNQLDMIFADINALMEYNLINEEMLEVAGQDYYDKNEQKTLNTIVNYENTVLTLNFSTLNKNNNFDILHNNSLIIYIRVGYDLFNVLNKLEFNNSLIKINEISYNDRDKLMQRYADIVVEVKNVNIDNVITDILSAINEYYK